MHKKQTKMVTLGAMIVALYGCLVLLNNYTGSFFDIYFCYFMVFPLIYFGNLYGWKNNLIVAFCASVVIAMLGTPFYLLFGIGCLLQGVVLAEGMVRKTKSWNLFFIMVIMAMMKYFLITTVFSGLTGIDFIEELRLMFIEMPFLEKMGVTFASVEMLLPALLVVIAAVDTYCILAICLLLSRRIKIEFNFQLSIIDLRLPKWLALISVFMIIIRIVYAHPVLLNMQVLLTIPLVLQGLSFIAYILWIYRKTSLLILFMLAVFIPYISYLYLILGIFDIFSDLRRNIMYNKHRS